MPYITPILLCLIPFLGYTQKTSTEGKAVSIISTSFFNPPGSNDTVTMFFAPDIALYKISKHVTKATIMATINDEEADENDSEAKFESQQTVLFFAFDLLTKKGASFNKDSIYEKKISYDSFYASHNVLPKITLIKNQLDSMKWAIGSSDDFSRIVSYAPYDKKEANSVDSIILYYNKKFMDIDIKLTENNDEAGLGKLQKIKFVISLSEEIQKRAGGANTFEFCSELKEPSSKDLEELRFCLPFARKALLNN